MLGRKHLWAPTCWDKGSPVNDIHLGCGPRTFLFGSTVGNAASPNYPSTPKTSKQKTLEPRAEKQAMPKCLKVLRIFSREACWCGTGKLPAISPFWLFRLSLKRWKGIPVQVRSCPGAAGQTQAEEVSAGWAVELLGSQVKELMANKQISQTTLELNDCCSGK